MARSGGSFLTFLHEVSTCISHGSRITVVTMAGAAIVIEGMSARNKILTVKKRVFAANPKLYVRRQRLVYSAGLRGMDALADDETLGGAGVAQDGSAELDVLVADLTTAEAAELGEKVLSCLDACASHQHFSYLYICPSSCVGFGFQSCCCQIKLILYCI